MMRCKSRAIGTSSLPPMLSCAVGILSSTSLRCFSSSSSGGDGSGKGRGGGGSDFFAGRSNFDEMMDKLKQASKANERHANGQVQHQHQEGNRSSAAIDPQRNSGGTAALPRGFRERTSAAAAAQFNLDKARLSAASLSGEKEEVYDENASFEEMMKEGQRLGETGPAVPPSLFTSASGAGLRKESEIAETQRQEVDDDNEGDSLYERELRHARQLESEHQRADFLRQRRSLGSSSPTSTSVIGGGSVAFGDRHTKIRTVDFGDSSFATQQRREVAGTRAEDDDDNFDPLFPSEFKSSTNTSDRRTAAPQPLSQMKREKLTRRSFAEIEDDEYQYMNAMRDDDDGSALSPAAAASGVHVPTLEELTALANDMTLLDDTNFAYFAPAVHGATDIDALAANSGLPSSGSREGFSARPQSSPKHVPGSPIIPPGFTRYRCDTQYQGSDFDGWDKSTEKMRHLMYRGGSPLSNLTADGDAKKAGDIANSSTTPLFEVLGLKPRAKKVLEDALAVALDMNNVTVHAAVMPETGAHVKRLVCHLDIPSSITMQPRTVLQRATLWLEQKAKASEGKHLPMAILSFYPCPDQAFDARYSTHKRVYVYRILNRIAPPLFDAGLQWHVDQYLDVDRMNRFAALMQGTQDYGCFADPQLGHSLRKSLQYSSGGFGSGNVGGVGGRGGVGNLQATNNLSMRFFRGDSTQQSSAEREVSEMIDSARRDTKDKTLSKRHMGYVGEDLLAEEAGSSSATAMRQFVRDTETDGGPSVTNPKHKHHARKDEFKQWNPYEEQDRYKLKKAAEYQESLYVDYSPVTTRTIDKLQVVRQDDEVLIWFVGKSFLRHQIRNMVSVLKAAGQGLWDERELKSFMKKGFSPQRSELKNRFPIAPVHGLTLWDTEQDRHHSDARYRHTDSGRTHEMN